MSARAETIRQRQQAILQQAKPSKYRNRKTTVDGIVFDSAKEAKRYGELKLLEKAGAIRYLSLQQAYPLEVNGKRLGVYRADFVYMLRETSRYSVVEDCKGFRTPLYKWKKRHVEAQYGIKILET